MYMQYLAEGDCSKAYVAVGAESGLSHCDRGNS